MNARTAEPARLAVTLTVDELSEMLALAVAKTLDDREAQTSPKLLTREALADQLGISVRSLDTLRGEGVPTVWVLDSPRFELDQVLEFLRQRGGNRG